MKIVCYLILTWIVASWSPLCAATIWQGSETINWDEGSSVTIPSSAFSDMQVADILRFSITFTGQGNYPQLSLCNGAGQELAATSNTVLTSDMTQVDYYVNRPMLADMQANGLLVTGTGFTLKAVDIIEGDGGAGYEEAVWIGRTVFPNDWSVYQLLPASCFAEAVTGNILRLCHQDLQVGAQTILRTINWTEMPGMDSFAQLKGSHTDIVISDGMLAELQKNGCFVQGIGFTLTSVKLMNKDDRPKLETEVPVVNDWMWFSPDAPTFRLKVTNPHDKTVSFDVEFQISDDMMTAYQYVNYTETLAAGESKVFDYSPVDKLTPGFYQATILVNDEIARSFNFGYDVTTSISAPDLQADFLDFWQGVKKELSTIDPSYTLTELTDLSTAQRKVYLLEMKSVPDATGEGIVRAFYAEPTTAGTYPAVLQFCGYDEGGDLLIPNADDHPDRIDLVVSTRGQSINNRPPYENPYGSWYVYGFGSRDTWYYRGAYMDCLRALEFLQTNAKVQQQNLFVEGISQGGAFTIVCTALAEGEINAIAPALPFLGDFPDYFRLVKWAGDFVKEQEMTLGMSEEEMYAWLSYFDTKNFAPLISCPVYMNFSLQDITCPPHTVWAAYNNLGSSEKQYLTNPTNGHKVGETWTTEVDQFFASHLKSDADGIQTVSSPRQYDATIYDLHGVRHEGPLSTLPPGIYIQQGRKVVR